MFGVSALKGACNVVQTDNRDANNFNWYSEMMALEQCQDMIYVKMSDKDFNNEKNIAKNTRRFGSWNSWLTWVQRIESKRAYTPPVQVSLLDNLISMREDYIGTPQQYFDSPVSRDAALYKLEEKIRKIPGGRIRLEKNLAIEHRKALPEIMEVINTVKRRIQAGKNCARIIAGVKIVKFVRKVRERVVKKESELWEKSRKIAPVMRVLGKVRSIKVAYSVPKSVTPTIKDTVCETGIDWSQEIASFAKNSDRVMGRRAQRREKAFNANAFALASACVSEWNN